MHQNCLLRESYPGNNWNLPGYFINTKNSIDNRLHIAIIIMRDFLKLIVFFLCPFCVFSVFLFIGGNYESEKQRFHTGRTDHRSGNHGYSCWHTRTPISSIYGKIKS